MITDCKFKMEKSMICFLLFILAFKATISRSVLTVDRFKRSDSSSNPENVQNDAADDLVVATLRNVWKERMLSSPHAVNILPAPKSKSTKIDQHLPEASSLTNMIIVRSAVSSRGLTVPLEPSMPDLGLGESLSSLTTANQVQAEPDFLPPGIVFGSGVPMVPNFSSGVESSPDQRVPKTGIQTLPGTSDHSFGVHLSEPLLEVQNVAPPAGSTSETGVIFANSASSSTLGSSLSDQAGVAQSASSPSQQQWVWPDGTVGEA